MDSNEICFYPSEESRFHSGAVDEGENDDAENVGDAENGDQVAQWLLSEAPRTMSRDLEGFVELDGDGDAGGRSHHRYRHRRLPGCRNLDSNCCLNYPHREHHCIQRERDSVRRRHYCCYWDRDLRF